MVSFLQRCNFSYSKGAYPIPKDFYEACIAKAKQLNLSMEGSESIEPYMDVGVAMSYLSYKHIDDFNLKVHIALFTAAVTYVDDNFGRHVDSLSQFVDMFSKGEVQADKPTMTVDKMLRLTSQFYDGIARSMLTTSTFNFITALVLQHKFETFPVCSII